MVRAKLCAECQIGSMPKQVWHESLYAWKLWVRAQEHAIPHMCIHSRTYAYASRVFWGIVVWVYSIQWNGNWEFSIGFLSYVSFMIYFNCSAVKFETCLRALLMVGRDFILYSFDSYAGWQVVGLSKTHRVSFYWGSAAPRRPAYRLMESRA